MIDLSKEIRAYALKNAIEFGAADAGRIMPKLFQHGLSKENIKDIMLQIKAIVDEVNKLSTDERTKQFEEFKQYAKEKIEEKHGLPELENASQKMVFRLAPYPSGALHLGNAKTYLLNALYAEKYKAKLLLVMDDTIGSEEKQIAPDSYKLIEDAFAWLGVNYAKPVIYKSDRLKIYYEFAEKLIAKGKAYVCHCPAELLRKNRAEGKECGCRQFPVADQKKRWKEMFKAKEGAAVLRIKTDMLHPNPAFRDRVLFKVSDREHPRVKKKFRVWPTLEMSWAIDDHELGITHVLRGNDLMIESDMEKYIWDIFGWKHAILIHTGLVRIEGMGAKISKSKAQKEVQSGEFTGWDDPRTWSVQSLARRGFKPESIRAFVEEIGLNRQDITVPIESLYAINRKLIDPIASRFTFIDQPVQLQIPNSPLFSEVEVPIHPDKPEKRKIKIDPAHIFISTNDANQLAGQEIRLLHLYNIQLEKDGKAAFTSAINKNIPRITWVSYGLKAKVLKEDGKWIEGFADEGIWDLKPGTVVQFERFGFVRFDQLKDNVYEFWFAHP